MIHQHNASTLLASKRKSIYYPPDGSGRDSYIRNDNGGTNISYRFQGVSEQGNFMKFGQPSRTFKPASYTRFQKYASDGSGRDKYVVSHHGGQYKEDGEDKALLIHFQKTLRDGGWKKPKSSLYGEFCRPSQIKNERSKVKSQMVQIGRLSEPKRKRQNYLKELEMRRTFHHLK